MCPKHDYWPLLTSSIEDLSRRFCHMKCSAPGIKIIATKRDIASAFTRCRVRPDASVLFGTEFVSRNSNRSTILFYLVFPLGFTGPPGIFGRIMQGVQYFHRSHFPPNPQWNGAERFSAEVFADDGMFIESFLGERPKICVELWEKGVRLFLGQTCISQKKLEMEGRWETEAVFLGFRINFDADLTSLPNPKITGAYNLLQKQAYDHGNCAVQLHDIQELRGCINLWPYTGRIWKWLTRPVNQLLSYADSNGLWIRCNDPEKWQSFWQALQFMREVVEGENNWPLLFTGVFSEIAGLEHEMTLPDKPSATWFSADATPTCIGGINCHTKEFFVEDPHLS